MNDKDNIGTIEAPKDVASACDISINNIFAQLHEKAKNEAESAHTDYKIQNSAIENKDGSFYGAGTHIIVASPAKEDGECTKQGALAILKTYVQWFSGPDIANKLTEDDLWPFSDEEQKKDSKKDEKKEAKKKPNAEGEEDDKEKAEESSSYIPSFKQFLLTEESEEGKDELKSKKEAKLAEDEENSSGYYIKYKLRIKGQPEKTLSDSLKNLGSEFIQSIGLAIGGDWRSGTSGKMHTIGGLVNSLKDAFGKLDPDKVQAEYNKQLKQKMPQSAAVSEIYDTNTVSLHCKKWLSNSDKSKLKNAQLAICTKVTKTDPSYKLFNPQAIADMLTKSISGIFKQFKNKVTPKDVILVNNYSDNVKRKKEKFQRSDGTEGTFADSINIIHNMDRLLSEAKTEKLSPGEATSQLQKIASSDLGKYSPNSLVTTGEKAVEKLKKNGGINEPMLFDSLKKSKYVFLLWIKAALNESTIDNDITNMLLEKILDKKQDSDIIEKVKKVFQKFILGYKDMIPDGKDPKMDAVDSIEGHVSDKEVKESIDINRYNRKSVLCSLFSSMYGKDANYSELFDDLLTEKNHNRTRDDKQIELKKLLKAHISDIRKNKDKIIDKAYTDPDTHKLYSWARGKEAETSGYNKFIKAIFDGPEDEVKIPKVSKNDIIYRFRKALKAFDFGEPEEKQEEKKMTKVSFYDADPETNEKIGKPLADIEVETGTAINSSEEAVNKIEELNKEMRDKAPKGFSNKGWDPDVSAKAEGEEMDIVAKYAKGKDEDKEKTFTVMFMYAPDQKKPKDVEPVEVNGKDEVEVESGGKVTPPKAPEIDGYEFKEWDSDGADFDNVTDDIIATAKYDEVTKGKDDPKEDEEKTQTIWYIVPDENDLIARESKNSKDKALEHTDEDFYIVPMPGLSYDAKKRYDASTQTIKDQ